MVNVSRSGLYPAMIDIDAHVRTHGLPMVYFQCALLLDPDIEARIRPGALPFFGGVFYMAIFEVSLCSISHQDTDKVVTDDRKAVNQ